MNLAHKHLLDSNHHAQSQESRLQESTTNTSRRITSTAMRIGVPVFAALIAVSSELAAAVWTVGPDPRYARYTNIQEAVEDPLTQPGDTIQIRLGNYRGNIALTKNNLRLRGEGNSTDPVTTSILGFLSVPVPDYISPGDFAEVRGFEAFALKLKNPNPADRVSSWLRTKCSPATLSLLTNYVRGENRDLERCLCNDINGVISNHILLPTNLFEGVNFSPLTESLRMQTMTQPHPVPGDPATKRLQRLFLEDSYPGEIRKTRNTVTFERLNIEPIATNRLQSNGYCYLTPHDATATYIGVTFQAAAEPPIEHFPPSYLWRTLTEKGYYGSQWLLVFLQVIVLGFLIWQLRLLRTSNDTTRSQATVNRWVDLAALSFSHAEELQHIYLYPKKGKKPKPFCDLPASEKRKIRYAWLMFDTFELGWRSSRPGLIRRLCTWVWWMRCRDYGEDIDRAARALQSKEVRSAWQYYIAREYDSEFTYAVNQQCLEAYSPPDVDGGRAFKMWARLLNLDIVALCWESCFRQRFMQRSECRDRAAELLKDRSVRRAWVGKMLAHKYKEDFGSAVKDTFSKTHASSLSENERTEWSKWCSDLESHLCTATQRAVKKSQEVKPTSKREGAGKADREGNGTRREDNTVRSGSGHAIRTNTDGGVSNGSGAEPSRNESSATAGGTHATDRISEAGQSVSLHPTAETASTPASPPALNGPARESGEEKRDTAADDATAPQRAERPQSASVPSLDDPSSTGPGTVNS